jgi:hypothetical protein
LGSAQALTVIGSIEPGSQKDRSSESEVEPFNQIFRRGVIYANRNDWSWKNGLEYGAAASQGRPLLRRF